MILVFVVVGLDQTGFDGLLEEMERIKEWKSNGHLKVHFIPFLYAEEKLSNGQGLKDYFYNFLFFWPMGAFCMTSVAAGSFYKRWISCFLGVAVMEVAQHFLSTGIFDLDDIIVRMAGITAGMIFVRTIRPVFMEKTGECRCT
jgi:glycopeptide antibiotics resistance protein